MKKPDRSLHRHWELKRLFDPCSIAIIGVSPNPRSFGARALDNLGTFRGRLHLVNPRHVRVQGRTCYPSVRDLPEPPDCALIVVPQAGVEAAVRECAVAGVGGAVIFAAGYGETGDTRLLAEQARLAAVAQETSLKILGPNCMGFVNLKSRALVSLARSKMSEEGQGEGIGLVSQSGAMGFGLAQAQHRGLSLSHVITTGNACDVSVSDAIAFLAEEPSCKAIACLVEGVAEPAHLQQAAVLAWEAGKPVVLCKVGNSSKGSAAARSHTGALAGALAGYRSICERSGMVWVEQPEAVMEIVAFLAKAPRHSRSSGVAILSASGGAAIIAADAAQARGVELQPLSNRTHQALAAVLPSFVHPGNPLDMTAMITTDLGLAKASFLELGGCGDYGVLVYPQATSTSTMTSGLPIYEETGRSFNVPICLPMLGGLVFGPEAREVERSNWVSTFASADHCFRAISAWFRRSEQLKNGLPAVSGSIPRLTPEHAACTAGGILDSSTDAVLVERESKKILEVYGIPVVKDILCISMDEAVDAAHQLGYPLVLKLESPNVAHKSDIGAVVTGLDSPEAVQAAYQDILDRTRKAAPEARINGVLVQPMVPAGVEVLAGIKVDPLFGPMVTVGLGGVLAELLQDVSTELAPVSIDEAMDMLQKLTGRRLLQGYRGARSVDLERLAELIVRLSEMACDLQEQISELDINPFICSGSNIVAVDALVVRRLNE